MWSKLVRIKNLFLIIFFFIACFCFSQQDIAIDSMLKVVNVSKEDTVKINTLNTLSETLWRANKNADARKYADSSMVLAKKLNFKLGIAAAYSNIGNIYSNLGSYPEALKNQFASVIIIQSDNLSV